ncbi:serine/threonine-protein kinase [Branchiibius sp. NY16-3462-2]|uniref:serine/threonine protein kinase n=1 Tax=Branchiibius sp. NY16-3462-2 TaxID=1807500 RepID=UPI00079B03DA|nr:serine/threonine-protein kinase [Branchiibius sp. NY16-3462-2]KYH44000.1 hypothetical protein AZH51_04440 [Branchiibius sp. NY16-3462-2]
MTPDAPEIPGYEVVRQIGSGGSSTVWAVRRPDGIRLAVKVLRDDRRAPESQWSAAVTHAHLLPVLDTVIGRWNDRDVTCLVMPLAEGGSLQDVLAARGHLTVGEIVTVLVPLAQALHHLHTLGIVHGDLKPANVLLTADGRPLLADLGVARLPVDQSDREVWATDRWSAPEVLHGQPADAASDAYGLGAIAWACAAGEPPPPAALRPLLHDEASHLPPAVCDVITACLSHTASARPSPAQFAELIWSSAQAEPSPVALSPGARTATTLREPGDELTRRLRSRAKAAADEPTAAPRRRIARGRNSAIRAHWEVAARDFRNTADFRARGRRPRHAVAGSSPWRRWVVPFVGLVVVAISAGWWLSRPQSQVTATDGPPSAGVAPTPSADSAPPRHAATAASAVSSRSPVASGEGDPAAALQPLLTARAAAWNNGDVGALTNAFAANSTAWQSDSGAIKTVVGRSAHYRGLDFRVRGVQLMSQSADRATVRAQILRTAATLTVGADRQAVPEQVSTVDLDLVRTPVGWRIVNWRGA